MSYLPLEAYRKAWVFAHAELPVSSADYAAIKPLIPARAVTFWHEQISKQADHPDFFKQGDWPVRKGTWCEEGEWEAAWESDDPALPASVLAHLAWEQNTPVFYCLDSQNIIETPWAVFQRCWKNFLFMDDGPLLLGKRRAEVVQFLPDGRFRLGRKS